MLANEKLIQAFNQQIGNEMGASMQYIAIASYFDSETLPELAKFFYRQSEEERTHAMKFVKFINDVGGKVLIPSLPAPKADFTTAEEAVSKALEWEEEVTRQIYDLVEIARADRNYVGIRFLDWFVEEQLEEVTSMNDLLAVIRRAGPDRLLFVEEYLSRQGRAALESPAAPSGGGE
ncbi:MAG: bacterioferritin [Acidobacteriota bacterium]|jgi:ferritin|nr:bacterioferritin [Acidobacteriota bacterium]